MPDDAEEPDDATASDHATELDDTDEPGDAPGAGGGMEGTAGFTDLVGLEITAVEDGYSRATLDVAEEHRNPYGGVHGAVLYAMADTGMGAALLYGLESGERMATIEIKISYVRPVTDGTVTCETRVLNRGRSVAYLESEVENDGRLVARATGSFSIFEQ